MSAPPSPWVAAIRRELAAMTPAELDAYTEAALTNERAVEALLAAVEDDD